jgi:hypothetical protein
MNNTNETLREFLNFVKKYKIVLISMLLSTVFIICGIWALTHKKEISAYEGCAKQIEDMSQNIIKKFQTRPDYWGLSTAMVINQKLYTQTMKEENGLLTGCFNRPVEIGADENGSTVMPTSKNFVISYNGLTKKQCVGLCSQKFNKTFWLNVNKIVVKNNSKQQEFIWGDKDYGLPISPANLRSLCQKSNNSIIIHF